MGGYPRLVVDNSGGGVFGLADQVGKSDIAAGFANNGNHGFVARRDFSARDPADSAGGPLNAQSKILQSDAVGFEIFQERHAVMFACDGKSVNSVIPARSYCLPRKSAHCVVMANGLKKLRSANHWSLERLSEESGVSVSQISRIERGESMPSAESMAKICQALQCSPAHIYMSDRDLAAHRLAIHIMEMSAVEREMLNRLIYGSVDQPATPEK